MVKEAGRDDKSEVYELWKHAYPRQNRNYLSFYFRHLFDEGVCLVQEQDHRIISSLQMNTHVMRFQGKLLNISYILGVSTLPDYRRRGHMRELMNSALDEASHNHLITLVKAFNPRLYEQFGFQVLYERKQYLIQREYLNKIIPLRVAHEAEAKELLKAYRQFIRHFDGYYERDVAYYETLLKELTLGIKQLVTYRDAHGTLCGYLIYQMQKNDLVVKEAVYMESIALQRMMKEILGDHEAIIVEVSQSEKLEKIFTLAIPKRSAFMMARINSYPLFNKLFNAKAKTPKEAYAILKKPLWLHEYY